MRGRCVIVVAFLLGAAPCAWSTDDFAFWVLARGEIQDRAHTANDPLSVGSLQKPFLVRAWAASHASAKPPRFVCTGTSGCWRPSGHGSLDLRAAIRDSCNTYFRLLARETPGAALKAEFHSAGFDWKGEMTEPEAIGLPGFAVVRIAPARLLHAFSDLVRTPWPARDDVRQELLEGLRDSAGDGTASGLGLWGFMAKTGTVPALDGAPLRTSGLALILDNTGFGLLGLLPRGTGREAAIRAGVEVSRLRPDLPRRPPAPSAAPRVNKAPTLASRRKLDDPVRVQMLGELRLAEARLRNVAPGPAGSSQGFVGPDGTIRALPGDHFAASLWRIEASKPPFERIVRGAIEIQSGDGPVSITATMAARDYANGVLKAELGASPSGPRVGLAAAVLRFLQKGPRHAGADVCDSTHCAWFVGEGPVPRWVRPNLATNDRDIAAGLTDAEWAEALVSSRDLPGGPDQWTAACGGDPASPHFIWGGSDRRVVRCARHAKGSGRVWRRAWAAADIAAVFGMRPEAIDVVIVDGQWFLRVRAPADLPRPAPVLSLSYDEAHRRLATRLGWDALPAPAARIAKTADGFVAEGVGFGHRVGLCLAP